MHLDFKRKINFDVWGDRMCFFFLVHLKNYRHINNAWITLFWSWVIVLIYRTYRFRPLFYLNYLAVSCPNITNNPRIASAIIILTLTIDICSTQLCVCFLCLEIDLVLWFLGFLFFRIVKQTRNTIANFSNEFSTIVYTSNYYVHVLKIENFISVFKCHCGRNIQFYNHCNVRVFLFFKQYS